VAGGLLHPLFQRAFAAAKRVQAETGLGKGRVSIASAAVDFIQGVFDDLRGKTALVIGAGKMAELTLRHLAGLKPARVLVCNRTPERAAALAAEHGGEVAPFAELHLALAQADVVVSSTGADRPIVTAAEFAATHRRRRGRHLAVIDLAVPRDFEEAIGEAENVFLWNIDHLERVRQQTLLARKGAVEHAQRIVAEEVAALRASLSRQDYAPAFAALDARLDAIADQELARLLPQLPPLTEDQQAKLKDAFRRTKNKFLHPLRNAAAQSGDGTLLAALRRLFGL
jgi:glutamyl-tRNA reductase